MTSQDQQIIRSVLNTLVELLYGLKKKEDGLTTDEVMLLEQYEQSLLKMLNEDLFKNESDENIHLNE